MPLPDADKRSPRVYTLLQNQDLENVTADTLADVADPIAIEEANEDELRRLCLIAFARMVTKGSFDGWLTAGGADANSMAPNPQAATFKRYSVMGAPFVGVFRVLSVDTGVNLLKLHPFIAGESGDIAAVSMRVATAAASEEYRVSFWSADSDTGEIEVPTLGTATIDASSTGVITQDTLSTTVTLVKGRLYWVGVNSSHSSLRAYGIDDAYGANSMVAEATSGIQSSGSTGYSGSATYTSGVPTSMPTLGTIDQDMANVWYDFD